MGRNLLARPAPQKGAHVAQKETEHYWLPESVKLNLTAFEAGWLAVTLFRLNEDKGNSFPTMKPGKNGEPIRTTMPARIYEKIEAAIRAIRENRPHFGKFL